MSLAKFNKVTEIRLGRRAQGFLVALVMVMGLGQAKVFTQEQHDAQVDCVGQYIEAIRAYSSELIQSVTDIQHNYSWWDPMRQVMLEAVGLKFMARQESAMFQLLACTAVPFKPGG